MKNKKKKFWFLAAAGILLLFIVGYFFLFPIYQAKEPEKAADTGWKLYCVNSTDTQVVSESWEMEAEETDGQIEELLAAFWSEPKVYGNRKVFPDVVSLKEWTLTGGQLTLDFDTSYTNLTGIPEILGRTAVVKTLCQVEGVEYVAFTVGGQPLMDTNAQPIGLMTSSDFIDNTGGETNYTQTVTLTLYFTGEDGKTLKPSRHQIEFDGTISLEELVVQQLIAGPLPEEEGLYPTIPVGTQLLKTSKKDEICYIDFNSVFLDKLSDITDEVAVYSVVNSMAELSGITKVQFTIDGEVQKTYRENLVFDGFFERNLDLVESEN